MVSCFSHTEAAGEYWINSRGESFRLIRSAAHLTGSRQQSSVNVKGGNDDDDDDVVVVLGYRGKICW